MDVPHLPQAAAIEAYGQGGFRFADMSHRGSVLCLPDGIWAWPVTAVAELNEDVFKPVLDRSGELDLFLIGGGRDPFALRQGLRQLFRQAGISVDCLATGPAAQTYNILLAEGRR